MAASGGVMQPARIVGDGGQQGGRAGRGHGSAEVGQSPAEVFAGDGKSSGSASPVAAGRALQNFRCTGAPSASPLRPKKATSMPVGVTASRQKLSVEWISDTDRIR